jgi:hypothetical protein
LLRRRHSDHLFLMWSLTSLTRRRWSRQLGCEPGDPRGASSSHLRSPPVHQGVSFSRARGTALPAMVADAGRRPTKEVDRAALDVASRAPNGAAQKSTRVVSVPRRGRGPPSSPGRRQRRRPDLARLPRQCSTWSAPCSRQRIESAGRCGCGLHAPYVGRTFRAAPRRPWTSHARSRPLDRMSDDFVMTESSSNAFRLGSPRDPSLKFRSGGRI